MSILTLADVRISELTCALSGGLGNLCAVDHSGLPKDVGRLIEQLRKARVNAKLAGISGVEEYEADLDKKAAEQAIVEAQTELAQLKRDVELFAFYSGKRNAKQMMANVENQAYAQDIAQGGLNG